MKKLILISALLFSFNGWADDEFPIELTCYIQDAIIQFHFDESIDESWYLFDKEVMPYGNFANYVFTGPSNKTKYEAKAGKHMNDFKEITIVSQKITVNFGPTFIINRLTGSITILGRLGQITGECKTGLKIETKRKF